MLKKNKLVSAVADGPRPRDAILVEHRLVTDRHRHRQTETDGYRDIAYTSLA